MKKNIKIISIVGISIIMMCMLLFSNSVCLAANTGQLPRPNHTENPGEKIEDPLNNPDIYDPSTGQDDSTEFVKMANVIIGILRAIGTILSVVMAVILGIKYMMGSVEEKAEYKKTMIPYIIGIILLFAGAQIVGLIQGLVNNF